MYEKHIDALLTNALPSTPAYQTALTAAIELMRAATPRSPEEELAYCLSVASDVCEDNPYLIPYVANVIRSRRAAARAEGYADCMRRDANGLQDAQIKLSAAQVEIERLKAREPDWSAACETASSAQLRLAQAEIKRLRETVETRIDAEQKLLGAFYELQTELTERDAEIKRLRAENTELREALAVDHEYHALQTKLSNLRTAAEIAWEKLDELAQNATARTVRAAIEASRT